MSLRKKFLLTLVVCASIVAAPVSWFLYESSVDSLRQQIVQRGALTAVSVREWVNSGGWEARGSPSAPDTALQTMLSRNPGIESIAILTTDPFNVAVIRRTEEAAGTGPNRANGGSFVDRVRQGRFGSRIEASGALTISLPLFVKHAGIEATPLPSAEAAIAAIGTETVFDPAAIRGGVSVVLSPEAFRSASETLLWRSILVPFVLVAGLLAAVLILLDRFVLSPMRSVGQAIESRESGDLSGRIRKTADDEIGVIGESINDLLDSLEENEQTLNLSDERIRDFAEAGADWFWETDSQLRFTLIKGRIQEVLGLRPDQIVGRTREEIFQGSNDMTSPEWRHHLQQIRSHRPFVDFETGLVLPTGEKRFVGLSGNPRFDRNGRFLGYRGVTRDITARKRQEEHYKRLIAAIDGLTENVTIFDADDRIIFQNKQFQTLNEAVPEAIYLGIRFEDHLRALLAKGYVAEALGREEEWFSYRMERHRNPGPPFVIARKNEVYLLVHEQRLEDGGTILLTTDISERVKAERKLEESESRLRGIIDHSPAGIVLKDNQGRFLITNQVFRQWMKIGTGEYDGKTVHDYIPEHLADQIFAHEKLVMDTGRPQVQEHRITYPDGVTRTTWMHKFPFYGQEGRCTGVGTIILDMTDQRETEKQLRQSQKMEVVGQLTGGVAHDFNNMLGIIIGNLDVVSELLAEDDNKRTYIAAATKAALHGADLNRQLLAFSRQQSLSPKVIALNENVSAMRDLLERTLGETIEIETVLSKDLWMTDVDPSQVESALLNLAVNARDAMPDGGTLVIRTANVHLDEAYAATQSEVLPGDYVMLSMSDSGTGMTQDVLEHAFEPFFTTKEVGEGTGLGLSMIFGFAKQSGGHLAISSAVDEGTTVNLYLPRAHRANDQIAAESPQIPVAQGETILVVEDDPDLRFLINAMLSDLGYRVLEASDGPSAMHALGDEGPINLLLSDVVLPGGMGGADIAREASRRLPGIKVLFMSGYPRNAITRQGRLDEGVLLLEKPFRKAAVAQKVREALSLTA